MAVKYWKAYSFKTRKQHAHSSTVPEVYELALATLRKQYKSNSQALMNITILYYIILYSAH